MPQLSTIKGQGLGKVFLFINSQRVSLSGLWGTRSSESVLLGAWLCSPKAAYQVCAACGLWLPGPWPRPRAKKEMTTVFKLISRTSRISDPFEYFLIIIFQYIYFLSLVTPYTSLHLHPHPAPVPTIITLLSRSMSSFSSFFFSAQSPSPCSP